LKKINLNNSKGISVIFLIIAMLLMVTIGYVFSYLIPTKQKSVVFPIQSTQAFFLAQSGVEFAVRYAKDQGWTTTAQLAGLTGMTRTFGAGSFTLTYTNTAPNLDTLTSVGQVPIGTARRSVKVSNFTTFLSYFAYRRSITVQAGQVTGTLTNFPMLISVTNANLATVANGGHIASYNAGTNDPQDLVFEALDDATCGGAGTSPCRLDHEIEAYVPATGQLVAWVRVPSITNGTVIYMYYGNGCISSSTQNKTGVWDSNYVGVWHYNQTGANPQIMDSTRNANNSASNASTPTASGKLDGAATFDGNANITTFDSAKVFWDYTNASGNTYECWVNISDYSGGNDYMPTLAELAADAAHNTHTFGIYIANYGGYNGLNISCNNTMDYGNGSLASTSTGTWHHVVVVFAGGTYNDITKYTVYLDGSVQTMNSHGGWYSYAGNVNYFGTDGGGGDYLNGILDEVRISKIARSAGWILTEYRNQNAPASFYTVGAEQNN
jgi:hypothetical protein